MLEKPCIRYFGALHLKPQHQTKFYSKGVLWTKITGALHLKNEPQRGDNLCRKIK